jgi:Tfp pilus assembly major pilin PilA
MQYFLIFVILVACGGAYYEHTLAQAQNDTDQAQITDLNSKIDKFQSDGRKLEDEEAKEEKGLAEAKTKITDLTTQLAAAQKAVADAKKQANDAVKALQDEIAREKAGPPPPPPPTNLLGTILTQDGKTYPNSKLLKADEDGITISCTNGITKLIYGILPPALQTKFGYDPKAAAKLSEAQVHFLEQQIEAADAAGN